MISKAWLGKDGRGGFGRRAQSLTAVQPHLNRAEQS